MQLSTAFRSSLRDCGENAVAGLVSPCPAIPKAGGLGDTRIEKGTRQHPKANHQVLNVVPCLTRLNTQSMHIQCKSTKYSQIQYGLHGGDLYENIRLKRLMCATWNERVPSTANIHTALIKTIDNAIRKVILKICACKVWNAAGMCVNFKQLCVKCFTRAILAIMLSRKLID